MPFYHVGIFPTQTESYERQNISFDVYQGIVAGDKSLDIISGQATNNKDIVLALVNSLIRKTTNTIK